MSVRFTGDEAYSPDEPQPLSSTTELECANLAENARCADN
ncbi:hypothetical protein AVEN_244256-1, partial [Araneus ventricosus]